MITGFKFGNLNVNRQGSQITVTEDTGGRRSIPSTRLTISANESGDHYEIRGEKDREKMAWDMEVSSFGVKAYDVSRVGRRGGMGETKEVSFMANVIRDYEQAALSMASTIVGVPLNFLTQSR